MFIDTDKIQSFDTEYLLEQIKWLHEVKGERLTPNDSLSHLCRAYEEEIERRK